MSEFSIGGTSTYRVTKKELIDIINKNFPEDYGSIAVITNCETTDYETKNKTITQSILFGKKLEY